MNRIRFIATTTLVWVACICLLGAGSSRADDWTENITMVVHVGGKPDGLAHVFDSEDFQRILLVLDGRPDSYVLELGEGAAYSLPRDSVLVTQEGTARIGLVGFDYAADLTQENGCLTLHPDQGPTIEVMPLPPLIGPTALDRLLALKPAYALAARAYTPDPLKIAAIKKTAKDTEIRVYFGTWCHICKDLVPKLIRTVQDAGNPRITTTYIGLDEDLTQPEADIARDGIRTTPTIIVTQAGVEIGRIEEKATTSVESDLARILTRS